MTKNHTTTSLLQGHTTFVFSFETLHTPGFVIVQHLMGFGCLCYLTNPFPSYMSLKKHSQVCDQSKSRLLEFREVPHVSDFRTSDSILELAFYY